MNGYDQQLWYQLMLLLLLLPGPPLIPLNPFARN
jgi:hypothetical protein